MKTQRAKNKKVIFPVNTAVPIYVTYTMHINFTPKGIYAELSVSHKYLWQMGPTYAVIPENSTNKDKLFTFCTVCLRVMHNFYSVKKK